MSKLSFTEWLFDSVLKNPEPNKEDITYRFADMFKGHIDWPIGVDNEVSLSQFILQVYKKRLAYNFGVEVSDNTHTDEFFTRVAADTEHFKNAYLSTVFAARTAWNDYQQYLKAE